MLVRLLKSVLCPLFSVCLSHLQLKAIESQARSLALTLGVGKLNDVKLRNALFGFVKEGIRYAFQSEGHRSEEDCNLGGHLTFLLVLQKYEYCALATTSEKIARLFLSLK